MKQRILFLIAACLACSSAWAYDFSAVAPTGQTLYYNITDSKKVEVTYANGLICSGYLTIPDTVSYSGTVYTVTSIGYSAFSGCTGLTSVSSLAAYFTTMVYDTVFVFVHDTLIIHDTVYIHDTIYITDEAVGDVTVPLAKVYSSQGQIVVEGAEGCEVTLYDAVGRRMAARRDDFAMLRFDVPASGAYLVKVGHAPARRVVVIK